LGEVARPTAFVTGASYGVGAATAVPNVAEDGRIIFSVPPTSPEHPEYRAQLVLCVHLATPSHADAYGTVDLNGVAMMWNRGSLTGGIAVEKKPQQIWYRRWNVFSEY
jgi:NAD(P)-dependent dehydrogenase (short-subunit alcohol dehydrogenase family)